MSIKVGSTRVVWVGKSYVIKLPPFNRGWSAFLRGLISNYNEVRLSKLRIEELAPVPFHLPLGLLVVMPKVIMKESDLSEWFYVCSISDDAELLSMVVSMTEKSVGRINDKVVAFDYGSLIKGSNEEKFFSNLARWKT